MPVVLVNKKANFEYTILERFEAGLSLSGPMVKQVRGKKISLASKFIIYQKGKLEIIGFGAEKFIENVPLLLNNREIDRIKSGLSTKGVTCVIMKIFTSKRWLKAEIALVRGKKLHNKKDQIKERDIEREMGRERLLK